MALQKCYSIVDYIIVVGSIEIVSGNKVADMGLGTVFEVANMGLVAVVDDHIVVL